MHLLGGVDQEEKERERAGDDRRGVQRQPIDEAEKTVEIRGVGAFVPSRTARDAEPFDGVEARLALDAPNDVPERARQQADVLAERSLLGAWLGTWRGIAHDG
jgi:hypothetical protein